MNLIDEHKNKIIQLCDTHHVETLYVFGSVSTNTLSETSDVDLLVKFKKFNISNYFQNYMDFKQSLQKIFNRDVDLVEEQTLSNPFLIKSINKNKSLIYG